LLTEGFDIESCGSCHSRYQSAVYRRNPGRKPSKYLVSKLRRQEALQRRCGPGTAAYSNALEQLRSDKSVASPECSYIVSISYRGVGNRFLAIATAAAFLYALLTDRVLLVDRSNAMDELFCEPFLRATWLLSPDFPLTNYTNFDIDTAERYGNMLKNEVVRPDAGDVSTAQQLPAFAYVHLNYDATLEDKYFFCDDDQRLLRRVQWLVMRTDNYIIPGMFLVPAFQEELDLLFPEPDTVFHHLSRYLFHPSNHVWGLVTRYYNTHLAAAQKRVGIQVRVYGVLPDSPALLEQITACTQKKGLLPEVLATTDPISSPDPGASRSVSVIVTSLKPWYSDELKGMYWEHATAAGEAVSVHQPSHEEHQRSGATSHDSKAVAEIYLLSMTDVLVTSSMSTFGYVAQGLGGVRPWVLYKPANGSGPADPPCGQDVSMEPCYFKPLSYDCRRQKQWVDPSKALPHVQGCRDAGWGVKLVGVGRNG
jgi:xyloglucan fucosyltransferase